MWFEMLAQAEIVKDVATGYLANGVVGLVALSLGVAVWWRETTNAKIIAKLSADKDAIQAARVADFQAQLPKLIDINTNVVTALTNSTRTLEAQQEASDGLKNAVQDLASEIRERKVKLS